MKIEHLKYLKCPKCKSGFNIIGNKENKIQNGEIICKRHHKYDVIKGIPRFVKLKNYSNNFGLQWNFFDRTQVDKFSKNKESKLRFETEMKYSNDWIDQKIILDVGCGAGRFLEHSSKKAKLVVGIDLSNSVEAAYENFKDVKNILIVQCDIYNLPFDSNTFDGAYSIGVIQHTPNPIKAIISVANHLKKNGVFGMTMYEKKKWTMLNGKYIIRHLTKRIPEKFLLFALIISMPILFPISQILFYLPFIGKLFSFIIPICDYSKVKNISLKARYSGVLLDTFDMLAPAYDNPLTKKQANIIFQKYFKNIHSNRFVYKSSGINLIGKKI